MSKSYTGSRRYTGPLVKKATSLKFFSLLEGKIGKQRKKADDFLNDKNKKRKRRKKSNFAEENEQIQKICYLYGLSKKQLKNIFAKIKDKDGLKEYNLHINLEMRLDNIIFLAGFGTRRFARQIVGHSHVKVNDKKNNIPSYKLKIGDVIELNKEIYENKILKSFIERNQPLPSYLEKRGERKITLTRIPDQEEIMKKDIDISLIVRRYSREV